MKAKDIKRAIDMLEAYRGDLDWWRTCGHDYWVDVTNGTGTYALEDEELLDSNQGSSTGRYDSTEAQQEKAKLFMDNYIADVQQAIADLTQLKETQSGETKVYELLKSYTVSEVYHVPADSLEQAIEIMDYDHKHKEYDGDYDTHPDGTDVVTGGGEWTREEYEAEYGEIES